MTKGNPLNANTNMSKYYIVKNPTKVSDLDDELFDDGSDWREKARKLQARRWAKIRDQLI
jgi:hypothetical protein